MSHLHNTMNERGFLVLLDYFFWKVQPKRKKFHLLFYYEICNYIHFFNHFIVLVCSLYVCILQKPAKLYTSRIKVVFLVFFSITIACESNFNMISLQPYVEKKQNFFCHFFLFSMNSVSLETKLSWCIIVWSDSTTLYSYSTRCIDTLAKWESTCQT